MIAYVGAFGLLAFPLSQASMVVHGVTTACCDLAKMQNASIDFSKNPFVNYTCGQTYSPSNQAAPDLRVNLTWCHQNCSGYHVYQPSETSNWAIPLISFILPAVIFSTQIPRRLGLKPLPLPPYPRWKRICLSVLYIIPDATLIVLDTTGWVFAIMIGAGPFILGGLVELWLDYKVICLATNGSADRTLTIDSRIEVLTAVLAGNLLIEGVLSDPQLELQTALVRQSNRPQAVNSLLLMLESQMTFGGVVGAAILLYLGSYVYTLSTLGTTEGDAGTARALAFGIWWMIIVHVSVVGGSLLASNNPSTAAAIVRRRPRRLSHNTIVEAAKQHSYLEDIVQDRIKVHSRIPLSYETRYEPAWMWSRGKNKALWLSRTSAWQNTDWFSKVVSISGWGWFWLFVSTYLLVLVPCGLAFWIEYRTPPVTVGCRSMTILLYMVAQTLFIVFSTWSHVRAFWDFQKKESCGWLRRKWIGICLTIFPFIPAWLLSVFATFAGTLMQITGIFQNCRCAATYTWAYRSSSWVSLATDTIKDRQSSGTWNHAGYSALAVLGAVTLSGWWIQRYVRDVFIERVEGLLRPPPRGRPERAQTFGLPRIPIASPGPYIRPDSFPLAP